MTLKFNGRKLADVRVEGVDTRDAPDFCDAYIADAIWDDTGTVLTEDELEEVNEDRDLVYNAVQAHIY